VSRSPTETAKDSDYEEGWSAINRMIRRDGSWSGHERNVFYLNGGGGDFFDGSSLSGLDFDDDARAFATFDLDADGDLDVVLKNRTGPQLRLLQNRIADGEPSLSIELEGTASNRDAVGARVELRAERGTRVKTVRAGSGYLSQSSRRLHFGLSGLGAVENVIVRWPSGLRQETGPLPANHRFQVREGRKELTRVAYASPSDHRFAGRGPAPDEASRGTWLLDPLPAPDVALAGAGGKSLRLSQLHGRKVLLNFWATWCPPCGVELADFAKQQSALERAGVELVAVSVDEPPAGEVVARFARQRRLELPLYLADAETVSLYDVVSSQLFDKQADLMIPTSFLLDEAGRIVKVYRGAVAASVVVEDSARVPKDDAGRIAAGLPFPGRSLYGSFVRNDFELANAYAENGHREPAKLHYRRAIEFSPGSAKVHYNVGTLALGEGQWDQAAEAFRRALTLAPDFAEAHNNYGYVLAATGRTEEAKGEYERALSLRPDFAEAWNNKGTLHGRRRELAEAIFCFQSAIAARSEFREALVNLSVSLSQAGRGSEAIDPLARAYALSPSPELCGRLARLQAAAGDLARARSTLQEGLDRWSDDSGLLDLWRELK